MKKKKILNTVVNVIVILIAVIVIIIAATSIASVEKGYNSYFGYIAAAVKTNSMEGTREDSFNKGDMLFVKALSDAERLTLKEGDVITFWDIIDGVKALNTHRIIEVNEMRGAEGQLLAKSYVTKGDNNINRDNTPVNYDNVVGLYTGNRAAGLGSVVLFLQSSTGFLCLVVVPSILLLIYALVRLILTIVAMKKEKQAALLRAAENISEEERERIRLELLAELQSQNEQNSSGDETKD